MSTKKQKQFHDVESYTLNPTRFLPSTSNESARQQSVAVYTRTHAAHAWQFSRVTSRESAQLEKDIQDGTEVLIVPLSTAVDLPRVLCSTQTQEEVGLLVLPEPSAAPVAVSESNTWTPGPWESKKESSYVPAQVWAEGRQLCEVYGESKDTRAANARIMAAAPDLYAALKLMLEAWNVQHEGELDDVAEAVQAKDALRKAVSRG